MKKLTRHNSFTVLKLSKLSVTSSINNSIQLPELEFFLNSLQKKLIKNRKTKPTQF